jgi:hypothetical protein
MMEGGELRGIRRRDPEIKGHGKGTFVIPLGFLSVNRRSRRFSGTFEVPLALLSANEWFSTHSKKCIVSDD